MKRSAAIPAKVRAADKGRLKNNNHESETGKGAAFIRSELDDYGLTPAQFRVYCRIARRGGCYESVPHMAEGCRIKDVTVRKALKFLAQQHMIQRTERTGQTSFYDLTPILSWVPNPSHLGGGVTPPKRGYRGTPKRGEGTPPITGQSHPSHLGGDKGNPSEGSPLKGHPNKGEGAPPLFENGAGNEKPKGPKLFPRELASKIKLAEDTLRGMDRHNPQRAQLIANKRKWKSELLEVDEPTANERPIETISGHDQARAVNGEQKPLPVKAWQPKWNDGDFKKAADKAIAEEEDRLRGVPA